MPRNAKASKKRAENNTKHRKIISEIEALAPTFKSYDKNNTGKLERDQVIQLLTDLDSTSPPGTAPQPNEVDYILQVADMRHNGAINLEELPNAIASWKTYLEAKPALDRFIAKHDENKSGGLDKAQMKNWLVDLNHGEEVTDEDMEYVWSFAHRAAGDQDAELHAAELRIALNAWLHHQEEKAAAAAAEDAAARKASRAKKGAPFSRFLMPRLTKMSKERGEARKFYKQCVVEQEAFLKKLQWTKYDTNNSGQLERDQLKTLLTDLDSTTPPGTPPTDIELQYILQVADARRNGAINKEEIANALAAWFTYKKYAPQLDRIMAKYDQSGTGGLSKGEVKKWLVDLNKGNPVSDDEAEHIVKQCDVVDTGDLRRVELLLALQTWFVGQTGEGSPADGPDPEAFDKDPKGNESACCITQ